MWISPTGNLAGLRRGGLSESRPVGAILLRIFTIAGRTEPRWRSASILPLADGSNTMRMWCKSRGVDS